ncbi:MAG: SDR family oxidoreductase [Candidatus Omnitrophota bacterium]
MNKFRIAITGATGLLGRNLLFEFLKQYFNDLDSLEIFVLGRDKSGISIENRIKNIILNDGVNYIGCSDKNSVERLKKNCDSRIQYIDIDLDEEKLDLKSDDLKKLQSSPIDFFFHIAALTDFRSTSSVMEALKKTNVYGTKQTLQLVSALKVNEFCYIGSAYSCGYTFGNIAPDYINFNQKFRNPYEHTKLEAEVLVRDFAKKTGIKCRYFRPSTICGRLIEMPLGSINKFDVFYSWAAFFLRLKLKHFKTINYEGLLNIDARICYSQKSGLNIVPADYAAKTIYHVCMQNEKSDSYHLVNNQETPHSVYIPIMLKKLNIAGIKQVDEIPKVMNPIESLYYRTIGGIFTPYINSEPMLFNTKNLNVVLSSAKLICPSVDEVTFPVLIDYAKKNNFNLSTREI